MSSASSNKNATFNFPKKISYSGPLSSLWNDTDKSQALIVAEENESPIGAFVMMELNSLDKVLVRRGHSLSQPLFDVMKKLQASHPLVIFSMQKGQELNPDVIYTGNENTLQNWIVLRQFLHQYVAKLPKTSGSLNNDKIKEDLEVNDDNGKKDGVSSPDTIVQPLNGEIADYTKETIESEIKRRRYTAFMADLENAVLYSLSHEVGAHASINGQSLTALREYLYVLDQHFPGRPDTMTFLHQLRDWAAQHDDAIRGEDLIAEINDLRASTGAFIDTPKGLWIGCKGSEVKFGGYPCSLWSLWHTLTVNQKSAEQPSYRVLEAMVNYVRYFFGCKECVRHFLQTAEDGEAVRREVVDQNSSILWLWRAHNKANLRLSGDLTDDKAFPKEIFPNRQHCSDCYTNKLGSDLWSEFNRDKVVAFLTDLYDEDNLSHRGLRISGGQPHHNQHEVAVYHGPSDSEATNDKRGLKSHNEYLREENTRGFFWSPVDLSLWFAVYFISAVILVLVYLKFVAKRNVCCVLIYNLNQNSPKNLHHIV